MFVVSEEPAKKKKTKTKQNCAKDAYLTMYLFTSFLTIAANNKKKKKNNNNNNKKNTQKPQGLDSLKWCCLLKLVHLSEFVPRLWNVILLLLLP